MTQILNLTKPTYLKRKELYREYLRLCPDSFITYDKYMEVLSEMNKAMVQSILRGNSIRLGSRMGTIRIKKIARSSSSIDWGETNKLKAKGINKHVYFTSEFYYRWYWDKNNVTVKNKSVYVFKPTKGAKGNKQALSKIVKNDPFIENVYKS